MIYDYKKKYFKVKREIPIKPIIIFFIALITLFLLFRQKSTPYPKDDSLKVIPLSTETKNKPAPKDLTALETEINKIIKEKTGTYSVYFNDFSTGAEIGINQNMGFIAASVNKIPILAAVYYFANQGEIDLDQKITIQASDIQDYGTGIIRYEQPGVIYSLKTLARLMMEKSDNTAAYVLASKIIGLKKIQGLADTWGLKQTDMAVNKTSNIDIYKTLKMMFDGRVTNESSTLEMIGFMDDSDFEERLPALLPENVKVYHKIGNEVGVIHDAGVIVLPNGGKYYLGVLTTEITDEEETKKTIAQISKIVYDFVDNKN